MLIIFLMCIVRAASKYRIVKQTNKTTKGGGDYASCFK